MHVTHTKRRLAWSSLLTAIVLAGSLGAFGGARAQVETYDIDAVHSGVHFKVRHFFTKTPGEFNDFSGVLQWNPEDPTQSKVEVKIDAASIDTDNEKRDNHLRSDDFLYVEKYPEITFTSTSVKSVGENRYEVAGDLTIRGITKPVILDVEQLGFGPDNWGGYRGGFSATTTIDRTDYDVTWNQVVEAGGVMLGDDVEIELEMEVVRRN
ncbi:MAG: polyisoprenoid-binding protein [Candidatus Eisenbacteria bacterium]|nr:polyisoprenoid-binding protein [Candidatus Eisenbacteria bacterium]